MWPCTLCWRVCLCGVVCACVFVCVFVCVLWGVLVCLSVWCGVVCVCVCLHGLLAYIQQRGLQLLSLISAVFDDGDEKTLRRSSLCLKGARHFAESEASPCHVFVLHSDTHPQLSLRRELSFVLTGTLHTFVP